MRILHVDSGRDWRGGQAQVLYLMEGLARRGHEQELLAWPGGPLADRAKARGLRVQGIPVRGDLDVAAILSIAGRARRLRAEVVHAHAAHAHAAAVAGAKLAGVRGRIVTRRLDLPVGGNRWSLMKYRDPTIRYVAISEAVAEALMQGGVDPARIRVVYSGVPTGGVPQASDVPARRRAREALGLTPDEIVVGVVGALTPQKGQDTAVAAMRHLPEGIRMVLIGDGPDGKVIEELIRSLGLENRICLAGFRRDIPELWPAFDLAVAPSRHEGLGTAVLEAMAAGVPVVTSSIPPLVHLLENGAVGELVEPEDAEGLAHAIMRLLKNDEARQRMARRGLERVKDYSTENMVLGTEKVYMELEDLK